MPLNISGLKQCPLRNVYNIKLAILTNWIIDGTCYKNMKQKLIYGSKGFHNTNPHIKIEISLLTTYTQEDKGSLKHYPSVSRLLASPNGLP